jgi:hypothetical protein
MVLGAMLGARRFLSGTTFTATKLCVGFAFDCVADISILVTPSCSDNACFARVAFFFFFFFFPGSS